MTFLKEKQRSVPYDFIGSQLIGNLVGTTTRCAVGRVYTSEALSVSFIIKPIHQLIKFEKHKIQCLYLPLFNKKIPFWHIDRLFGQFEMRQ